MAGEISDEYLRQRVSGELEPSNVELIEYDPRRPERFRDQEQKIRSALGQQARRVEHIGSTSVPGLAAKPVIDILLVVDDAAEGESEVGPRARTRRILDRPAREFARTVNPSVSRHV